MDTNTAGIFLLGSSAVVGLALLHPFLLSVPVVIGVVLIFVGASDMPADSPRTGPGS
jgi:hypothetical protein